uniref:Protein 4.1 n=1 Tax=Aceria tosichella TaxID=561515 RepID=A0A6G1SM01_9ACAR
MENSTTNMNEQAASYFHRKFYAHKFKRSEVTPPLSSCLAGPKVSRSSVGSIEQSSKQCKGLSGGDGACEPCSETTTPDTDARLAGQDAAEIRQSVSSTPSKNSYRFQDCDEAGPSREWRVQQEHDDDDDADDETRAKNEEAGCNERMAISGDQEAVTVSATVTTTATTLRPPTPPNDHIETLNFHPDTPPSAETSETSEMKGSSKGSRLSKATRAILLFRRATTSLNNVNKNTSATSSQRDSRACKSSKSFVASFWRQSTTDNSSSRCDRSSRLNSFASFNNSNSNNSNQKRNNKTRSHHSLTAFLSGGGGSTGVSGGGDSSALNAGGDTNQADPMGSPSPSSSFSLPRFIVPKMNALKLPIVCLIKSLEDELMREIFIHRYELGQYLIDNLKVSLGMRDEKYFGLKMADSLEEQEDVRRPWLDLNESVYKQISKHGRLTSTRASGAGVDASISGGPATCTTKSVSFYLRIKFYPPNLARIQDQFLKQYLWLQLRRDLRLGKLTSSMNNLTYLMACTLQYELGDYSSELVNEKLPTMSVLPNQDLIEQQAIDIWQHRLLGAKKHLVLMQFLRASVILETYGFDYYPVRDHQRQRAYLLGFNYAGVKTIRNGRIVNHFRWHNLSKISYERRMIIFHIYPNENSKRKQILGFKCLSNDECQNLYLRLLEQKYFFTVDLTYFDKSIRRPSHLASSMGVVTTTSATSGEQHLGHQMTSGEQAVANSQLADFLNDELDEADLAEDEEEQEEEQATDREQGSAVKRRRPHSRGLEKVETTSTAPSGRATQEAAATSSGPSEQVDELSKRRLNYQHGNSGTGTSNKSTTLDSSSLEWHNSQPNQWQPVVGDHPASSFSQASDPLGLTSQQPSQASNYQLRQTNRRAPLSMVPKSDSLQEPGHSDIISCERTDCFSQPGSPSSERLTCCRTTTTTAAAAAGVGGAAVFSAACFCCATTSTPQESRSMPTPSSSIGARPNDPHYPSQHHQQAFLQRQCSFVKYSPDYEFQPDETRLDHCNSLLDDRAAMVSASRLAPNDDARTQAAHHDRSHHYHYHNQPLDGGNIGIQQQQQQHKQQQ